jgi:[ribosomal protein S5]-alanine N-acetyltransferase
MTPFADLAVTTARLTLRPLAEPDAADLFALFGDPAVMRYWSTPPWTDAAQALTMVAGDRAAHAARSDLRLGLLPHETQRVVGTLSLFRIDRSNRRAEIGYALSPAWQGRGLVHEALVALITLAFDASPGSALGDLALHRLEADIDPRNTPSARVLERLGFRQEGLLRERWQVGGEVSDSALYGLLRPDFKPAG